MTLAAGGLGGKFLRYEEGAPSVAAQTAYGIEAEVEGYDAGARKLDCLWVMNVWYLVSHASTPSTSGAGGADSESWVIRACQLSRETNSHTEHMAGAGRSMRCGSHYPVSECTTQSWIRLYNTQC